MLRDFSLRAPLPTEPTRNPRGTHARAEPRFAEEPALEAICEHPGATQEAKARFGKKNQKIARAGGRAAGRVGRAGFF